MKLSNLPVLIKNKFLKFLFVLGIIVPLFLLWYSVNILKIHQTDDFLSYMFLPIFFISLALLPLTGFIKDIVSLLPLDYLNKLSRRPVNTRRQWKDPIHPTNKELNIQNNFFELQRFGFVTGIEWLMIIFGSVFFAVTVAAPFITGHF